MIKYTVFWLAGLLCLLGSSCINQDLLNISDSSIIHSRYSLPLGEHAFTINRYLESLDTVTIPHPDSVYFNDVLYPNISDAVYFSSADSFSLNLISHTTEKIRSIQLVVVVSNGYPTDLYSQVYFRGANGTLPADSAFSDGARLIPAAAINGDGLVTDPTLQVFTVDMPPSFVQDIAQYGQFAIAGKLETNRSGLRWVRFLSDYKIQVHVGFRIELLYDTGKL